MLTIVESGIYNDDFDVRLYKFFAFYDVHFYDGSKPS